LLQRARRFFHGSSCNKRRAHDPRTARDPATNAGFAAVRRPLLRATRTLSCKVEAGAVL
jgi:hypothetical protein